MLLLRRQSKGFVRTSPKFRAVTKDRVRIAAARASLPALALKKKHALKKACTEMSGHAGNEAQLQSSNDCHLQHVKLWALSVQMATLTHCDSMCSYVQFSP